MVDGQGTAAGHAEHGWHGQYQSTGIHNFTERMIRAARFDKSIFEEVEADSKALGQAILVVVLASVAAGIGNIPRGGAIGILTGTAAALVSWFVWAFLTYLIGTRLMPEPQTQADYGQLLRTVGFSSSPGLIRVFGFIPVLGPILFIVAAVWMLIAMVVGVRQALDYVSTARAIIVVLIGWLVQAVVLALLFIMTVPA